MFRKYNDNIAVRIKDITRTTKYNMSSFICMKCFHLLLKPQKENLSQNSVAIIQKIDVGWPYNIIYNLFLILLITLRSYKRFQYEIQF